MTTAMTSDPAFHRALAGVVSGVLGAPVRIGAVREDAPGPRGESVWCSMYDRRMGNGFGGASPNEEAIVSEIRRRMAERTTPLLVAFDGRSGSGKSTLASRVAARVAGRVVEGDDFHAGGTDADWDRRTVAEKVADCIDWRRLRIEAIEPLRSGRNAAWRPFNFETGVGLAAHTVGCGPAAVIVLDGAYSSRPVLADLLDLPVLVEASNEAVRRQRLIAREGADFMARWHALWDAAEEYYFTHVRPRSSFDMVVISD